MILLKFIINREAGTNKSIERFCRAIYKYFNNEIEKQKPQRRSFYYYSQTSLEKEEGECQAEKDLTAFHDQACIWVGSRFVKIFFVAKKWTHNGPYLFCLPDILSECKRLVKALK